MAAVPADGAQGAEGAAVVDLVAEMGLVVVAGLALEAVGMEAVAA